MKTPPSRTLKCILLVVAGAALAAWTPLRADQDRDHDRGRDHDHDRGHDRRVDVSIGIRLPHGYADVVVGREHYYHYRGTFYRPGPHGRLVVIRAPHGAIIRELPPRCVRFNVGPVVYFRFGDIYYRQVPAGFMVVAAPMGPGIPPPPPPRAQEFLSVWAGPNECLFKDGQFFQRTPEGLVWMEAPYGALSRTLPEDAVPVWVQNVKYFQSDNVYFRETPQGFQIVPSPFPPS